MRVAFWSKVVHGTVTRVRRCKVSESAGVVWRLGRLYTLNHGTNGIPSDVPAFDEYDDAADSFLDLVGENMEAKLTLCSLLALQ
jgi:hypothetical protein